MRHRLDTVTGQHTGTWYLLLYCIGYRCAMVCYSYEGRSEGMAVVGVQQCWRQR